jgi:hypothetical protein
LPPSLAVENAGRFTLHSRLRAELGHDGRPDEGATGVRPAFQASHKVARPGITSTPSERSPMSYCPVDGHML